jgi:hypothetical protein
MWREKVRKLAGVYRGRRCITENPWDYEQTRIEVFLTLPSGASITLRWSYWLIGSPTFEVVR